MSQYFSRLAQRSGWAPSVAGAAAPGASADIVEHHMEVDGIATSPAMTPASVPPLPAVGRPQTASPVASLMPVAAASNDGVLRSPAVKAAPATSTVSSNDISPRATDSSRPDTAVLRESNVPTRATNAIQAQAAQIESIQKSDANEPSVRRNNNPPSAPLPLTRSGRTERGVAHDAGVVRTDTVKKLSDNGRDDDRVSEPTTDAASPVDAPLASLSKAARLSADVSLNTVVKSVFENAQIVEARLERAPATSPSPITPATESRNEDVNVRIGAVRLEIHAPVVAPAEAQTVAPVAPPEPPRFALRRHYLRS